MKKKLLLIFMLLMSLAMLLMSAGCTVPDDNDDDEEEDLDYIDPSWEPYHTYWFQNLGRRTLPIGAWIAPPCAVPTHGIPAGLNTAAAYKDVADSGINAIYGLYEHLPDNRTDIMAALGYAESNGIVYFMRDRNANNFAEMPASQTASYSDIMNHKGFGGVLIQDEPGMSSFDDLAAFNAGFKDVFKNASARPLFYVNMMPSYASKNQLEQGAGVGGGGKASAGLYEQYIDDYLLKVKPPVYSYDYYPMMGTFPNIESDYFSDLALVREKTLGAEVPFWTFIQSASWGSGVRVCTQAEVDYQVNTALAFGAKGIQYFTYWTPYDDAGTNPGFYPSRTNEQIGAMVSASGEKQPMYYRVQKTNLQVKAAGYYLLHSANLGVIQNGPSPAPIPSGVKLGSFRELTGVTGDSAVVGCFEYRGRTLLYVVNNGIENEATVNLTFSGQVNALTIQRGVSAEKSGASLELTIEAGDGVLVLLDLPQ